MTEWGEGMNFEGISKAPSESKKAEAIKQGQRKAARAIIPLLPIDEKEALAVLEDARRIILLLSRHEERVDGRPYTDEAIQCGMHLMPSPGKFISHSEVPA